MKTQAHLLHQMSKQWSFIQESSLFLPPVTAKPRGPGLIRHIHNAGDPGPFHLVAQILSNWPPHCPRELLQLLISPPTLPPTEKGKQRAFPFFFIVTAYKLHLQGPLTSHWLEHNDMTESSCKRV